MAKAISTFQTYLMHSTDGSTWNKLIDITNYPDMRTAPEAIDVTTLSDPARCYIAGIMDNGGTMAFGANYTPENYAAVKALEGTEQHLALWFGASQTGNTYTPTGSNGKFAFDGYVQAGLPGKGVNEAVGMNVYVTPSTPIEEVSD